MEVQRNQPDGAAQRNNVDVRVLDEMERLFGHMLDEGLHPGGQIAIYRNGELIVDLAGGVDGPEGNPVTPQTLFQIRSCTKSLACTVMLLLHDRGLFSFDDLICQYWPGFAKNGKESITIAQLMGHRAGLVDNHPSVPVDQWGSRQAIVTAMEESSPAWPPGTANGYHASSIGWIIDELVLRMAGRPTGDLLREEITGPLGIEDVYLGLPEDRLSRMAKMVIMDEVQRGRARTSDALNSGYAVRLPLSWISGMATARDIAKFMSLLAYEGTYLGKTFFSRETFARATTPTNSPEDIDRGLQRPIRWGLGYILGMTTPDIYGTPPHVKAAGHAGGGASVIWGDPERRLGVAFLCNGMQARGREWERYRRLGDVVYKSLS